MVLLSVVLRSVTQPHPRLANLISCSDTCNSLPVARSEFLVPGVATIIAIQRAPW